MPKKFYITSALPYVNAAAHCGHALEFIQADVLARYHRSLGEDVVYLTGTDEHGVKNVRSAEEAGIPVEKFVDENSARFRKLIEALHVSVDYFIRTTDRKIHWPGVEKMWRALQKCGDIYKKQYKGFYCVGHEAFITKKDLEGGRCILHKSEPEIIEEENYFFRLSKYTEKIKKYVTSGRFNVIPKSAENELFHLLDEGLSDVSASRPAKDLKWGIPIPWDSSHVSYVWLEALVSYISGLGYGRKSVTKFKKYWPADVQVIGKDILRFHAAIWPGMLLSAGLPLPKTLFVHGFISVGGEKMSKTIGNVVDPFPLVEKYGADAVRYYFLREIPATHDGDFTYEKFEQRYAADLAKGLGNFTARVVNLGARHIRGSFTSYQSVRTKKAILQAEKKFHKAMRDFRFDEALQAIWELIAYGDKFVDSSRLWELPDKNPKKFASHMAELCTLLGNIAWLLGSFLPGTSKDIARQIGINLTEKHDWKFKLKKGKALFPMLSTSKA